MRLWQIIALWVLLLLLYIGVGAPIAFWGAGAAFTFGYLFGRLQAFNPRRD